MMRKMDWSRRKLLVLPLLILALPAFADDDPGSESDDDERASLADAVSSGAARPLSQIQADLAGKLPGDIVSVDVEKEGGVWTYEFKTISPQGKRADVYVDAATGTILRSVPR